MAESFTELSLSGVPSAPYVFEIGAGVNVDAEILAYVNYLQANQAIGVNVEDGQLIALTSLDGVHVTSVLVYEKVLAYQGSLISQFSIDTFGYVGKPGILLATEERSVKVLSKERGIIVP